MLWIAVVLARAVLAVGSGFGVTEILLHYIMYTSYVSRCFCGTVESENEIMKLAMCVAQEICM